jgi:hypothetical protein
MGTEYRVGEALLLYLGFLYITGDSSITLGAPTGFRIDQHLSLVGPHLLLMGFARVSFLPSGDVRRCVELGDSAQKAQRP